MGDPVTTSLIATGGTTLASSALGGVQQKNSLKAQEYQLTTQKKAIETNAAIQSAERYNKLQSTMSSQNAVFAGRGQTSGFGSAGAIQQDSMNQAAREQANQNLNTKLDVLSADYNIQSAKDASSSAMSSSLFNSLLDTSSNAASVYSRNNFSAIDKGSG